MDTRTEIYDTVIDGKQYTFDVRWFGGNWQENEKDYWLAYAFPTLLQIKGDSAEEAALKLVKLLEK